MKSDNIFISIAGSIGFVLLCIVYSLTLYEFNVDWSNMSSIILGIYLYLAYLFLISIWGESGDQMRYFQRTEPHGKDRQASGVQYGYR